MGDWLYLIIGIVVVAIGLAAGLVTSGRRRRPAEAPAPTRRTDVIAPPRRVGRPGRRRPARRRRPQRPPSRSPRPRPPGWCGCASGSPARRAGSAAACWRCCRATASTRTPGRPIEDTLLTADVGVAPTQELVERLRTRLRVDGTEASDPRAVLREELVKLVGPDLDRRLQISGADGHPGVVLVVGVNGTGKTTTVGKLARILVAEDKSVVLGAADTFRAAAVEQLATWGERVGVEVVRGAEGGDPASVAFDAVREGDERGVDTVIVDTAGRLQNKAGLMDELGKVKRVIEKVAPVTEVLLVLDATTGQNGLIQARVFAEVVDVTGIVLTKLDGSAKGGIVVAVQRELGVPVKLVGLGEGPDDLAPFDPRAFVDALLG